MPELTIALLLIIGGSIAFGAIIGWALRTLRSEQQKVVLSAEWREQLEALTATERRVNSQRKELSAELADARTQLADLQNSFSTEQSTSIEQATPNRELEALQEQLDDANARRTRLRREFDKFIQKSHEFAAASKEKDEKIFALSRELESWQQRLPPLVDKYREKHDETSIIIDELEAEKQLSAELSNSLRTRIMPIAWHASEKNEAPRDEANSDASTSPTQNGADFGSDDLTRIKGVGPALVKILNSIGIFSLSQVAEFDEADIERISAQLPQFPGRIRRDRWVEQARELSR